MNTRKIKILDSLFDLLLIDKDNKLHDTKFDKDLKIIISYKLNEEILNAMTNNLNII